MNRKTQKEALKRKIHNSFLTAIWSEIKGDHIPALNHKQGTYDEVLDYIKSNERLKYMIVPQKGRGARMVPYAKPMELHKAIKYNKDIATSIISSNI